MFHTLIQTRKTMARPEGHSHAYYQVLIGTIDTEISAEPITVPSIAVEYEGSYFVSDPKMHNIIMSYLQTHEVPSFFFKHLCAPIGAKDVEKISLWKLICYVGEDNDDDSESTDETQEPTRTYSDSSTQTTNSGVSKAKNKIKKLSKKITTLKQEHEEEAILYRNQYSSMKERARRIVSSPMSRNVSSAQRTNLLRRTFDKLRQFKSNKQELARYDMVKLEMINLIKHTKLEDINVRQIYHSLLGHVQKVQRIVIMIYAVYEVYMQIVSIGKISTPLPKTKCIQDALNEFVAYNPRFKDLSKYFKFLGMDGKLFIQDYLLLGESLRHMSLETYQMANSLYERNIENFKRLKVLPITKFPCTSRIHNNSLRLAGAS